MVATCMHSAPQMLRANSSKAASSSTARPQQRRATLVCRAQQQQKAAATAAVTAAAMLVAGAAHAVDPSALASTDLPVALGGGAAIAALGAALVATDPQKRRTEQMAQTGGNEKEAVRNYFNTAGFERWNKIYGETDEVNKVQLDIRTGHAQTVDKVLRWVDAEGGVKGTTFADCGCGTGSLTIPLAMRGAQVSASDISSAMVEEASRRFQESAAGSKDAAAPVFEALDLESVSGKYHTVACLDVMIHYPQDKVDGMISHLASLAEERLIISFAPKTLAYSILKRIGELFPGPSKATRAYLHAEADVEAALQRAGWKVVKREMTATQFYFSRLVEAVRA